MMADGFRQLYRYLSIIFLLTSGWVCAEEPVHEGRHLFILSGQSNMTGGLENGFTETVSNALGKDSVKVVRSMKSGRGIRFWVKDYSLPEDHALHGRLKSGNGEEYPRLLKAINDAGDARNYKSVTLIWMQGESDANRDLGAAYAKSFETLMAQLKSDLGITKMYFVIGRISDHGLDGDQAGGWKTMRATQMRIAESDPLGAWIDTDDLNGGDGKNPRGGIHYPSANYPKLGARFAEQAIKQLEGK